MSDASLSGRTIAVPETRELDVFSAMLERRGAQVVGCPLDPDGRRGPREQASLHRASVTNAPLEASAAP